MREKRAVYVVFRAFRKACIALGGLLILLGKLQAQMEISVDSNRVETGNPFRFYVKFPDTEGKPDSLDFSVWQAVLPPQNIVERTDWEHDGNLYKQSFTAIFFDADTIWFPSLNVALRNGRSLSSNLLTLIVYPTLSSDDLNDMAPIKDIHREGIHWTDYWPWMLGVLGVLAIIAAFYWFAQKKTRTKLQSRAFETPAHILALKKLDALAAKQLVTRGMVKEHYSELSYLLREYLEKRFGIPVLESTTDETLAQLRGTDFPEDWKNELKELLEQADLAKFAKIIPDLSFYERSMSATRDMIQYTQAVPDPEAGAPE